MMLRRAMTRLATTAVVLAAVAAPAGATNFTGTIYYTDFKGATVNKVTYSYNDATQAYSLTNQTNITTLPGADGIIFAPNGNLLVGGQNTGYVYEVNPTNGTYTRASTGTGTASGTPSYHLSLAPSLTSVYTSNFGGNLVNIPLSNFGSSSPSGTTSQAITGGDTGITTLTYAPNVQKYFYINGGPNNGGNFGTIDPTTGVTTRLISGLDGGHGMVYDPFTQDLFLSGGGTIDQIDPNNPGVVLHSYQIGNLLPSANFDQLAVDGNGHMFVAGSDSITFIDYSGTKDVSSPNFVNVTGGFDNIDDVAPLVGLGSNNPTPEPSTLVLAGIAGLTGLGARWRRRRATAA